MDAHKNFAVTAIAAAPTPAASGTSATVLDASVFPATPFNATVCPSDELPTPANAEIVRITSVVGNVITFTRAQESSNARTILVGDLIAATITSKVITDIENAIPSTAGLISAINVSAGAAAQNLSALTFSNGSGVSFGLAASVITASVETAYQSQGAYLTTAMASNRGSDFVQAGAVFAGTNASGTIASNGISVSVGDYLTTAALSNHSHGNPTLALTNLTGTTASASNGFTLSLSAAAAGAAFQSAGFSTQGNTAGNTGFASQSLQLVGGNNITLSGSTGAGGLTLTISGANAGGAQTGISGLAASGGTITSGTASFSNANGVSFGVNGQTITASVETNYQSTGAYLTTAALSSQTLGFSLSGNIATTNSSRISNGAYALAGGNNVTIQQSNNTVSISVGNYITTARASTDAVGLNTAQSNVTWTVNSAGISLDARGYAGTGFTSAGANIGLSGTLNTVGLSLSATVAAQTNQSAIKGFGVSNTGQTAGNTGISSGIDWVMAGSGSITLSQSTAGGGPNTVWIQHPAWITTQSGQAFSADAMSNFQTLVFQDSNGVSFSNNAGSLRVTHGLQYTSATSAITSNALHSSASRVFNIIAATNSTGGGAASLSSNVSFSAANGFTFYTSAGNAIVGSHNAITTARASTDAIGLNTAQTNVTWTVNSSGISLNAGGYAGTVTGATGASITVNTSGVSINLPAYLTTADLSANSSKYIQEWALTGNTAGTTSSAQGTRLYLSGGNGLTLSGSSNSIVFSVGNYLTTARGSTDAIGLNTAQTNVTWTVNSSGLSFNAAGYAGTGTSATNATITLNSNGLAVSVAAPGAAAEANWVTLQGNIVGNSSASGSTIAWSGGNGVTLSGTNNSIIGISVSTYSTVGTATSGYPVASANSIGTITRWAAEDHRHAGIGGVGISTAGNTAGTTGTVQGTYWFQGSNVVTVSQITSNNGSHTLVIAGKVEQPLSYWRNAAAEVINGTATMSVVGSTSYMQPFVLDKDLSASYIRILQSVAVSNTTSIATSNNATGSASLLSTVWAMLYTKGTGASSNSLQSVASASAGFTQVWSLSAGNGSQWTLSQTIIHPITGGMSTFTTGVTTSLTNYSLGSLSLTRFTGLQHLDLAFGSSLSAGNYWLVLGASSTTSTGGSGAAFTQLRMSNSLIGATQINSAIPLFGQVSASSIGLFPGLGSFSTNAIGTTASLDFSNISSSASHPLIPVQFLRVT